MQTPSASLLRAVLQPWLHVKCHQRTITNYVNPAKYHKVNALDKLHRRQKQALRQERLDSIARANAMASPLLPPRDSVTEDPTTPTQAETASASLSGVLHAAPASPPEASSLPYTITRTNGQSIPVYHDTKNGGNKHLTLLRKLSGDLTALQRDIREALGLEPYTVDRFGRKKENVAINWTTRQIVVRGWRGPEIKKWAEMRGF